MEDLVSALDCLEDANDRWFIARNHEPGLGVMVSVSAVGMKHLRQYRSAPAPRERTAT